MFEAHFPLLIMFTLAALMAGAILFLSTILGPKRPSAIKSEPFECGNEPSGPPLDRFNVKFFLVAILFLVFDIEAVFIYPWAVVFRDVTRGGGTLQPTFVVLEMVVFVAIILVGLTYAWRKGALEWNLREEQPERVTTHHE